MTPQMPQNMAPTPTPATPAATPWYAKSWVSVLTLIFFAPVGWFLMWKYQNWSKGVKVAATIVSFLFFVSAMSNNDASKQNTASVNNAPASAPQREAVKAASKPERQVKAPVSSAPATSANRQVAAPAAEDSNAAPSNVEVINIEGIGKREAGMVDKVAYAIERIEKAPSIGNEFSSTQADGVFVIVRLITVNTDKETHQVTTAMMKLQDSKDREFDTSSKGTTALVMSGDQTADLGMAEVQPDTPKRFSLVYDVPQNASGFKIKIPSGTFSLDQDLIIKAP
jgi:hypothetical protein